MGVRVLRYQTEHEPAVAACNARLRESGAPFSLPERSLPAWLPPGGERETYREAFLAFDGEAVRGGFALRHQPFWLQGEKAAVANYQGPISEGIFDRRYALVGATMLRAALRERPLLYALGMGGLDKPLPRLLAASGWWLDAVPFRFRVADGNRFVREVEAVRGGRWRSRLLDFAASIGLAGVLFQALHAARSKHRPSRGVAAGFVSRFGPWADAIWERAAPGYALCGWRDRATQDILYPAGNPKNRIVLIREGDLPIGWGVVRLTPMNKDRYFGSLRLGFIVDVLALPGREADAVSALWRLLRAEGADLVATNQAAASWNAALAENGFLSGPSNFIFAASPALKDRLGGDGVVLGGFHINRSDGDGPIHI